MYYRKHIFFVLFCLILGGCATSSITRQSLNLPQKPLIQKDFAKVGVYHRVKKGQTLWRISKIYGIDLDDIVSINNITDSTQVQTGQSIFIPKVSKVQPTVNYISQDNTQDFIWPIKGRVNSSFGEKNGNVINKGINVNVFSSTDVLASRSGTVVFVNNNLKGYGKTIILDHNDGFMTVYSRLLQILVKPGERINQGMSIAKINQGSIHFEIRKGHIPQNPYYYLPH